MTQNHAHWQTLQARLQKLSVEDLVEEPELMGDAYDALMDAYHEARELNDEMAGLLKEYAASQYESRR